MTALEEQFDACAEDHNLTQRNPLFALREMNIPCDPPSPPTMKLREADVEGTDAIHAHHPSAYKALPRSISFALEMQRNHVPEPLSRTFDLYFYNCLNLIQRFGPKIKEFNRTSHRTFLLKSEKSKVR